MFPVLQIKRPLLAAVCYGLFFGGWMALSGAVLGTPLLDLVFEVAVSVIVATAVGAAVNPRLRPPGLAERLSTAQVRQVVRWLRSGETVDDRAVARAVIDYAGHLERGERRGRACFFVMLASGMPLVIIGDPVFAGLLLLGVSAVVLIERSLARARRQRALATARALLGDA